MQFPKQPASGPVSNDLLEIQSAFLELCEKFRALVAAHDEQARQREAEQLDLEIFDEDQVAAIFSVSAATIARRRDSLKLPHLAVGSQIRYTRKHVLEIAEIFEQRKEEKGGKRRESHLRQVANK